MKKLMLSTAVAAFAFVVSPAFAQDDSGVKLNLGGHFKGYMNYTDEDDTHSVDILRDTEVHFGGETTLDNGLTVGAQIEAEADAGEGFAIDESYVYFAGGWGRVNFGDEDGAAYLLQVAAPAADDNIDGIRQFVNPASTLGAIDYANDVAGDADKVTYLTPVMNGFQAGLSYTPEVGDDGSAASRALTGNSTDSSLEFDTTDVVEAAVRYEGVFNTVGVILGGGYTAGSDSLEQWNVGADLDIGAFGFGAIYTEAESDGILGADAQSETWVVGADYTTGPFKLGVSYLNNDLDTTADVETDRFAGGVVYTYGPGMSFRGSVGYVEQDDGAGDDDDATTVTLGTQINF